MWEYKVLDFAKLESDIESVLNKLGREGWELVDVLQPTGQYPYAFLKRCNLVINADAN